MGAGAGGVAVLLGALAHSGAGGSVRGVALVLLVAVGALVGAAALEFGFGRWGLVTSIAALQVAAHVLLNPVQGHRGGGHQHGVAGQVADANASVFVDHLTGSAALMVALHIAAFAVVALLLGATEPLLDLLARVSAVLRPRAVVAHDAIRAVQTSRVTARLSEALDHIVVRRGPPALV